MVQNICCEKGLTSNAGGCGEGFCLGSWRGCRRGRRGGASRIATGGAREFHWQLTQVFNSSRGWCPCCWSYSGSLGIL